MIFSGKLGTYPSFIPLKKPPPECCLPADHVALLALKKAVVPISGTGKKETWCSYSSPRQGLGGRGRNDSR